MSGQTFVSNVDRGAALSEQIDADIVVFEGSGSSIPSVHTDARILVVGANQPVEYIRSYLGPYRVLTSDLIILTMCEPPIADQDKVDGMVDAIRKVNPGCTVVKTIFRPRPIGHITGKKIVLALTAPQAMTGAISTHLEKTYGCVVQGVSTHLSNRPLLREDLARFEQLKPDAVVSELKAAAVDVVTAWAVDKGFEVVYIDNEPISTEPGVSLEEEVLKVVARIKGLPEHTNK